MSEGEVGNAGGGGVKDLSKGGQSDKFWTTGRQSANELNLRWVYYNYLIFIFEKWVLVILICNLLLLSLFIYIIYT